MNPAGFAMLLSSRSRNCTVQYIIILFARANKIL